ncbi:hypothetical protein MANES_11G091136v8 [Manihot esculenta]|uniref:Uncharacterized protein n=1 Tax=Manihot esculenta TaxID=3983 RepID=A0ACB7GW95_MANES|nr:hypothetical protein MANES_11G091136v8 [Manihot esculenta]
MKSKKLGEASTLGFYRLPIYRNGFVFTGYNLQNLFCFIVEEETTNINSWTEYTYTQFNRY